MDEYKAGMSGIYTTSVSLDTLDKSPMSYKSIDEIVRYISPTAEIVERVLPAYNFKAGE